MEATEENPIENDIVAEETTCNGFSSEATTYEHPPRIGDEYQVNLPPLCAEIERWQLTQSSTNSTDDSDDNDCNMRTELPIPISWVPEKIDMLPETSEGFQVDIQHAMPGLQSAEGWSDFEAEGFLLSLYIFGKNLAIVSKFIESKSLGSILSFYYGKFYKSSEYRRWSECRKSKNKRCVLGQRIFTGWRQQDLLSRLIPNISAERQNSLLKATRSFTEGAIFLEEYVFSLKDIVGMKSLVEVIGIGKGKCDLTGIAVDHVRGNQAPSIHSEIPAGKECSTLTSGEIIKFLTGNFRLSKTRSNDLFWEAVWPRLLAKGWRSEQPNDHNGTTTFKPNLVFIVPGVKKFSRSKLLKGDHYFDSVADVLSKVASDPMLLVLEMEGDQGNIGIKEDDGDGWSTDSSTKHQNHPSNSNSNSNSNHQSCYLRPRLPNFDSDDNHDIKFTVVDTSLVQVRELRSLPLHTSSCDHVVDGAEDANGFSEYHESGWEELYHPCSTTSEDKKLGKKHKIDEEMAPANLTKKKKKKRKRRISSHDTNGHYLNEQALEDFDFNCGHLAVVDQQMASETTHEALPIPKKKKKKNKKNKKIHRQEEGHHLEMVDAGVIINNNDLLLHAESDYQQRSLIDLNVAPLSEETTETIAEQKPEEAGCYRRQGTRSRPPTARALEALASGFLTTPIRRGRIPKAKKSGRRSPNYC